MSLRVIHLVFIAVSSLLALGVALWAVGAWMAWGDTGWLAFATGSLALSAGLVVYGVRFIHKCRISGIE